MSVTTMPDTGNGKLGSMIRQIKHENKIGLGERKRHSSGDGGGS